MAPLDYSADIRKAVRHYWRTKDSAWIKNKSGGRADQGKRGAATGGKNFDGFAKMFGKFARKHGGKRLGIHLDKSNVVLPGHFRPSKQWDLVLTWQERLIAVVEFKAASYQKRMTILCERMVQERIYTAAAALASPPGAKRSGYYTDLSKTASLSRFLARFIAHVKIESSGQ